MERAATWLAGPLLCLGGHEADKLSANRAGGAYPAAHEKTSVCVRRRYSILAGEAGANMPQLGQSLPSFKSIIRHPHE